MDVVLLSRLQFAAATMFHFLFVPLTLGLLIGVAFVVKLFSPGSSAGVRIAPGPLSGLGNIGETIALLLMNLLVAGLAMVIVSAVARRSRSKVLRTIAAVEQPVPGGK